MSKKHKKRKQHSRPIVKVNKSSDSGIRKVIYFIYGNQWTLILLILIVSMLFRLIYLPGLSDNPTFLKPTLDAQTHLKWAKYILNNNFSDPFEYFRAPLYPFFLSLMLLVGGKSLFFVRIAQFALGCGSNILVFLTGKNLFSKKVGLVSALFSSVYWLFIYFEGELLITSLLVFLTILLFYLLSRSDPFSWIGTAAIGLTAATILYTRPNIMLFLPILAGWIFFYHRFVIEKADGWLRRSLLRFALLSGILLTAMLGFGLRQKLVSGHFTILPTQGGINFYIGNAAVANGREALAFNENSEADPVFNKEYSNYYWKQDNVWFTYNFEAYKRSGRIISQAETSSLWRREAQREIQEHPGRWIGLTFRKIYYVLNSNEISSNQDLDQTWKTNAGILGFFRPELFGILLILLLVYIILDRKSWKKHLVSYLFFAITLIGIAIFFVNTRFRMAMLPLLIIYSSAGVFKIKQEWRNISLKTIIIIVVAIILTLGISYSRLFDVTKSQTYHFHYNLGRVHLQEKRYSEARDEFMQAVRQYPTSTTYLNNLAFSLIQLGHYQEAEQYLIRSRTIDASKAETLYYSGLTWYYQKNYQKAEIYLQQVKSIDPSFHEANYWVRYASLVEGSGKSGEADRYYKQAIIILEKEVQNGSENADNIFLLGILYSLFKQDKKAIQYMKQSIQLDQTDPDKHGRLAEILADNGDMEGARYHYEMARGLQ